MGRLITEWAWLYPRLKPAQRLVLLAMADRARDEDALYWETQATLCRRTGQDLKTVKATLKAFVSWGLIFDTGQRVGYHNGVVVWQIGGFTLTALNQLQEAERIRSAQQAGRVIVRPQAEVIETADSPKTDPLVPQDPPKTDYLDAKLSTGSPFLDYLTETTPPENGLPAVDNSHEVDHKRTVSTDPGGPKTDHLTAEVVRFSHRGSPFLDAEVVQKRTTDTKQETKQETLLALTECAPVDKSPVPSKRPKTKAALERERMQARYAPARERMAKWEEVWKQERQQQEAGSASAVVQTDDKD